MTGHNTHYYGLNRVEATESLVIKFATRHTTIGGAQIRSIVPTVKVGAGLAGYTA